MHPVVEIGIFFFCACFAVCAVLWMYGELAGDGHPGLGGFLKSVGLSLGVPALALGVGGMVFGRSSGIAALSASWTVGAVAGISLRLVTRPAKPSSA